MKISQAQALDFENRRLQVPLRIAGLPKDESMKHIKLMAIGILLLLGVSAASAQSLADYAREVRKNKTETSAPSHHYDNDNLPTGADLSVVGPEIGGCGKSRSQSRRHLCRTPEGVRRVEAKDRQG